MTAGGVDLVVRDGIVVGGSGRRRGDVLIEGEHIVDVVSGSWPGRAEREVDASGCFVLPGLIDTHVHLMDPGDPERETFPQGTAAAAASGVTTIVEHTHAWPVHEVERLHEKVAHLRGRSHVDFGLAAHVWPDRTHELDGLWRAGVAFFKIFTCTTHGVPGLSADELLSVFGSFAASGSRTLVHCEDEAITASTERALRAAGRVDPGLLTEWRSREAEIAAVAQVAALASVTQAVVRVAHASAPAVVELVGQFRDAGAPISAETCPQYLLLRESEVVVHGALRKFTPPARIRDEGDRRAMWSAVNDGGVDQISSDHAPSTRAQKAAGTIWDAPFGLPGLDTTSSVLIDAALRGDTKLEQVAALYSERPARHFGLRRKGSIGVGFDADLVIVDPLARRTVDAEHLRSGAGWSPYEGRSLRGAVASTYLRGRCIYDGERVSETFDGRFLPGMGWDPDR